jgi:hypothetical protein
MLHGITLDVLDREAAFFLGKLGDSVLGIDVEQQRRIAKIKVEINKGVRRPATASEVARLTAIVVRPAPPRPLYTAITRGSPPASMARPCSNSATWTI